MHYDGSASTALRDALRAILRQRRVAAGVYVGIVATAIVAIFALAPQYRAVSKVLVTSNSARVSTSQDKPTELVRATQMGDAELNSQVQILHSRDLVAGALRDLGADVAPPPANLVVRVLSHVLPSSCAAARLPSMGA
jgi:uncharacterized protein involved in exopolysaccharide biosynthesis